jgi:LmbE family N-acetylglucosaminyl deacetylase
VGARLVRVTVVWASGVEGGSSGLPAWSVATL